MVSSILLLQRRNPRLKRRDGILQLLDLRIRSLDVCYRPAQRLTLIQLCIILYVFFFATFCVGKEGAQVVDLVVQPLTVVAFVDKVSLVMRPGASLTTGRWQG